MIRSTRHFALLIPLRAIVTGLLLVVCVPFSSPAVTAEPDTDPQPRIAINTADAAALAEHLPGVGPVKAQAIIDHREREGSFATVEALLEVKGIGPVTLEKLRPLIVLSGIDTAPGSVGHGRSIDVIPAASAVAPGPGFETDTSGVADRPEISGYFTLGSAGAEAAARLPGSLSAREREERRTVQAVREVIQRVLDDGAAVTP